MEHQTTLQLYVPHKEGLASTLAAHRVWRLPFKHVKDISVYQCVCVWGGGEPGEGTFLELLQNQLEVAKLMAGLLQILLSGGEVEDSVIPLQGESLQLLL